MNKKYLRTLLLMLLPAFFVGQAFGQKVEPYGFVGENLIKQLWEGDFVDVTLGTNGNTSECVYEWKLESAPDGVMSPEIFNSNLPKTKVRLFGSGAYVFYVTRVSKYGYQREYVTVVLYEDVTLVSVKSADPEKCWSPGDPVREIDFDFETEPPGYDYKVKVAAADATIPDAFYELVPIKDQEIHFTIDGQEGIEEVKAVVPVIKREEVFSLSTSFGTSNSLSKMKKNWQLMKEAWELIKDAKRYTDNMNKYTGFLKKIKYKNQYFQPIHDMDFAPSATVKMDCCDGDAGVYLVLGGAWRITLGGRITAPIPYCNIPGLGGLMVSGAVMVLIDPFSQPSFSFPLSTLDYKNCFQTNFTFPIGIKSELVAGVDIISPDICSAVAGFQFDVNANFRIHTSSPVIEPKGADVKLYAKIEATLVSFTATFFKYELYPELKQIE